MTTALMRMDSAIWDYLAEQLNPSAAEWAFELIQEAIEAAIREAQGEGE